MFRILLITQINVNPCSTIEVYPYGSACHWHTEKAQLNLFFIKPTFFTLLIIRWVVTTHIINLTCKYKTFDRTILYASNLYAAHHKFFAMAF